MRVRINTPTGSFVVDGDDSIRFGTGNNSTRDVRARDLIGTNDGHIWTRDGWIKIKSVVVYQEAIVPKRKRRW